MHLGNIVVRLHVPDDWDEDKLTAAEAALAELCLLEAVAALVRTHTETREALNGLRAHVSSHLE